MGLRAVLKLNISLRKLTITVDAKNVSLMLLKQFKSLDRIGTKFSSVTDRRNCFVNGLLNPHDVWELSQHSVLLSERAKECQRQTAVN